MFAVRKNHWRVKYYY